MSRRDSRPIGQRQLRVGEELRHVLAAIFEKREIRDPGLSGTPITVSEVRVTPDLRRAVVFVAPLGGGDNTAMLAALSRARPFLRHRIAEHVHLKFVPDLVFRHDDSFEYAAHIEDLLRNLDESDANSPAERPDETD
ncbi:MAG: 30S ribosome-binding factor RbfA [Rhodospirillales bacterium]|nr:30S ribosome-binding factor RbfA [Rhodospirillales bacterium]